MMHAMIGVQLACRLVLSGSCRMRCALLCSVRHAVLLLLLRGSALGVGRCRVYCMQAMLAALDKPFLGQAVTETLS